MNGMSRGEFYMSQSIQMVAALITSIIQTGRITGTVKRYERISFLVKGIGIIVAGIGTLIILKKLKNGTKMIQENNFLLKNK